MNFTFGIITTGNMNSYIKEFLSSIDRNNIPENNYEVIIVGGSNMNGKNIKHIPFNEGVKHAWITRKKNIITENAKFENIVYLHDYIRLEDGWYDGFLNFGNDWEVCMNRILNSDGTRFRDWVLAPWMVECCKNFPISIENAECLLPYNISHLTKLQYISGSYWVAKKDIMNRFKLNENLSWGQSEDVEFSWQLSKNNIKYVMNDKCTVKIIKGWKDPVFNLIPEHKIEKLKTFYIKSL